MKMLRLVGLVVSLLTTMCCGICMSFPVYAIKLKTSFRLNQSQVELVAGFVVMGWSFQIVTAWVIRRFGYQACYILVLFLTVSSNLLMWVASNHVAFFRENIWLLSIFQFLNTSGCTGSIQCLSAITSEDFSKRHSGKIIGAYTAALGFGKFYYSALFEIFFDRQETMSSFFLTVAISFACLLVLCYCLHRPHNSENSNLDQSNLIHSDDSEDLATERKGYTTEESKKEGQKVEKSPLRNVFTSSYFYLMGGSHVLFTTSTNTFINNVTSIGAAAGSKHPIHLVYILSVVIVTSRLAFGAVYDYFGTMKSGFILLFVQYLVFGCSMLICFFWLEGWMIYVMVVLGSVGCGAGYSLPISLLISKFGVDSYPVMTGVLEVVMAPTLLMSHLVSGWTYDNAEHLYGSTVLFCQECFFSTYLILLSLTIVVLILQSVNVIIQYTILPSCKNVSSEERSSLLESQNHTSCCK